MGEKLGLVVAVEKYKDGGIAPVPFAEADAKGFAEGVKIHGFEVPVMLLSHDATKTTVESRVRRALRRLTKEDELFIFYAGHGFSRNGSNYITCADTDLNDLQRTSVSLPWLFREIGDSKCERVAMFLDSCESGITDLPEVRGVYSSMTEEELEDFFRESEYRVCFASCKVSESSYSSGNVKHGIWSYHVLEALGGKAPQALEKGRFLTANSLQNYLSNEVPRTLKKAFTDLRVQTPWLYGSHNRDFVVADLKPTLEEHQVSGLERQQLKQALFRDTEPFAIKSLSGFKKRVHFVPESRSSAADSFVESISRQEVEDKIGATFDEIRESMKYKRRDLHVGRGKIISPDFEYSVYFNQDEDDPSKAIMTTELTNVNPKIIKDDGFNEVFDRAFTEVVVELTASFDVEKLVDRLEDEKTPGFELDYPHDCSWCKLSFTNPSFEIRIDTDTVSFSRPQAGSPAELVEGVMLIQRRLAGTSVLRSLPLGAA